MKRGRTAGRYDGFWDRIFPRRHAAFWNWDDMKGETRDVHSLQADFTHTDAVDAKAAFEHVQAIADSALTRADAADRRATTIAGGQPEAARHNARAAHLLDDFAFNWEVSILKNHLLDNALWALVAALVGIGVLAVLVAVAVA